MYGRASDDLHRRRQDSYLEDASSDRTDIAGETGIDKVLVNLDHGSVTAMTGPNEVTVYTVRVGCERFEMWRDGVCSLKCQNEAAEITMLNTADRTRRVKTIPRNTTRYSHDSVGHCDSSIAEVEKQIRVSTRGEQTTNAIATDMLHGRLHNAQSTLRSKRHFSSG